MTDTLLSERRLLWWTSCRFNGRGRGVGAIAVVGALVGIVVGLTSTGGGALLTPALLFLGVPPSLAVGSDVVVASGIKLFGGGAYALRREVDWPTVWKLAAGSVPGAVLGVLLLNRIPKEVLDHALRHVLGVALV